MEELIQKLHTANVIGALYAELGWYNTLAEHWNTSIKPLVCQLWEIINA